MSPINFSLLKLGDYFRYFRATYAAKPAWRGIQTLIHQALPVIRTFSANAKPG